MAPRPDVMRRLRQLTSNLEQLAVIIDGADRRELTTRALVDVAVGALHRAIEEGEGVDD